MEKLTINPQPLKLAEMETFHFGPEWHFNKKIAEENFHINRLQDFRSKIKFPLSHHRKTVFDFIFLEKGESQRSKGLQDYHIGANTFFFLPAYQISSHAYLSEDCKGYYCHFTPQLFRSINQEANFLDKFPFYSLSSLPVLTVPETLSTTLVNHLHRLFQLFNEDKNLDLPIYAFYLSAIFEELRRFASNNLPHKKQASVDITEKYKNLLAQHIFKYNRVTDYARLLNIHADHLNKSVKEATGYTAQDVLLDMVLLEAKVMLKQTTLNINEIAYRFSEMNHSDFSRLFKLKTNMSPKEYRLKYKSLV